MSQFILCIVWVLVVVGLASSADVYKSTGKVVLYNRGDSNWEIQSEGGAPFIEQMSCEEYECDVGFDCTMPVQWKCTLNTAVYRQQTDHACQSSCPSSVLSRLCTKRCSAKTTVYDEEATVGAALVGLCMFVFVSVVLFSCICGDPSHHRSSNSACDFASGLVTFGIIALLFGDSRGGSSGGGNATSWSLPEKRE